MHIRELKRRDFIIMGGAAAAWPLAARAQRASHQVIGILNSGGTNPYATMNKVLVRAILEAGFVEERE
jgi:putative ABC transport system substrate-binding protein